jgi:pyruvyltransferase
MITIAFSTRKIDLNFIDLLKKTSGIKSIEILPFENNGEYSLTQIYNTALEKSSNDIIVLCHDDIYFDTNNWGNKLLKHLKRNPEYGIIGAAGSKFLPESGRWWEIQSEMFGIVNHESQGKKWTSRYSESKGNKLDDTIVVDGLFICINKKNIVSKFDETIKGFHFYDVDFCFNNFLRGVKIGVFYDIRITHKSIGITNDQWENNRKDFVTKNLNHLPKLIPTIFEKKQGKKKEPLVSIIMPIFNYAKRLNPTLSSIFNQDYSNFEIIIANDGSTDKYCLLKLESLKKSDSIKIIHKENTGVSSTRNFAIKESNGDYILPLDADDMILPSYIKTAVDIISNNPQISPVYCDTHHIGEMQGIQKRPEWSKEQLMKGPFIVNSSLYSKESYNYTGGYDENLQGWEDYDLWIRMMKEGYVGKRIPKPLFVYFHHEKDGSISNEANKNQQELYHKIMKKNFVDLSSYVYNGRKITPDNTKNWGDLIPFEIIEKLSCSKKIKLTDVFSVENPNKKYKVYSTGSVMLFTKSECIVWGSGCIDKGMIGEKPKKIFSVRGPLTREELLKRNWDCPEIYGDPALLYPLIYNPKIEKKYKFGFIPHYIEFESAKDRETIKNLELLGVQIIDVCAGSEKFIDELLECEYIISSSLHGLIASDAYGIPNARVNVSNKLIGGDFKFLDYYKSVGRKNDYGLQLNKFTTINEIENLYFNKKIEIDLTKLLSSAPWNHEEFKSMFY